MKIGFDYWRTISRDPELFAALFSALMAAGHEVHVVTAVGRVRVKTIEDDFARENVPCTALHVVEFKHPREAPYLKLEKCKELELRFFMDDRMDTCEVLAGAGILTANLLGERRDR